MIKPLDTFRHQLLEESVILRKKNSLSAIAPEHDMVNCAGEMHPGFASHGLVYEIVTICDPAELTWF